MRFFSTCTLALCSLVLTSAAQADIVWNVTYNDVVNSTGVGFNDASLGASRRATFESVLAYVSNVTNESGSVNFTLNSSRTDGTGSLASAGSLYSGLPGFQKSLVQQGIQGTSTFAGSSGSATFDFGYNWNSVLAAPSASQFDLFSVSLHEMTHAMGFASLIGTTGESLFQNGNSGTFSNYDQFLRLSDNTPFFTGTTFTATADNNANGIVDVLESNQVVFTGANAIAANGGVPVPVYSPSIYSPGSSISHITNPTGVMQFSIAPGVAHRSYNNVELGILKDMGYSGIITAVPEPSSFFAVSLFGLFATVCLRRTRKSAES